MGEYHDENTLFKVRDALTDAHFEGQTVAEIILTLQNAGILFREFVEGETAQEVSQRIIEEVTHDVQYEFMQPVSKEEFIRLECLHMATETIPLNRTGNEDQFIERANIFEKYIKEGNTNA